ncbi:hypothetical protein EWM64_g456 [Hericium alpestre]|uniref:Uncharacterized protein n=1 Tax=Hericium alpestre TaxID=135208 RepID=A0A4Z0A917_9AGAM|nr:hypothetical protein EWM64_g456 [Hericium alpestre]
MVLSPGDDKFTELTNLSKSKGSWDGGDQGLLNEWRGNDWHRLSFIYNTTPTAAYTYAPAYERFGSQIAAIHFIGPNKPWNSIPWRAPGSTAAQQDTSEPLQAYDYSNLVDRWFAVYDKHYRSVSLLPEPSMRLGDTRLPGMAGVVSVPRQCFHQHVGEGEYIRLPLAGRVDLMRPKPEPISKPAVEAESAAGQAPTAAPGQDTMGYFGDVGSALSTPTPQKPQLPGEAQPRMYTLPTPGPSELPPTPYHPPLSLPPTPAADAQGVPVSTFPTDTYYPNVWDESARDRQFGGITSPPSSVLFSPPPPSQIPQHLLQEGHYTNVLGEKRDAAPEQDQSKVKPIFPWEEQPRHRPDRHFPDTDALPPGLFIEREPEPSSSPSPSPEPVMPGSLAPPPVGMPKTFAFRNVWDSMPSIQKYASRLSRPQQPAPALGAPFDIAQSRKMESKLFSETYEVGDTSQDGDDEDTEPEENPIEQSRRIRSGPGSATYSMLSGKGKKKEYRTIGTQTIPKETRNQGVQVNLLTLPPDVDRMGQGKDGRAPGSRARRGSTSSLPSGMRQRTGALDDSSEYTPSHMASSLVGETVKQLSPLGSPTGLHSPRAYSPRTSSPNLTGLLQSPPKQPPALRTVTEGAPRQRTVSSDTMSTSPSPSSAGLPPSPKDVPAPLSPPVRKAAARVWDPARGVDVFKRGSEEVLARFLRMGSWEEEASTKSQT